MFVFYFFYFSGGAFFKLLVAYFVLILDLDHPCCFSHHYLLAFVLFLCMPYSLEKYFIEDVQVFSASRNRLPLNEYLFFFWRLIYHLYALGDCHVSFFFNYFRLGA